MIKPEDGYIAYIINPKSGASSAKTGLHTFKDYLMDKGYDVRLGLTTSLKNANELAAEAAVDLHCALVVVVGGDGTIREVVQGLEGSDKKLLIIPGGTENLLANELGFDEKIETVIEAFEEGQVKALDLGKVNDRFFTAVVGFGFDAFVIDRINQTREGNISYTDYFWPVWRTFWNFDFPHFHIEADGETLFDGRGLVIVGNISHYAMGLGILKDADYGDGLLDICVFKCQSKLHLIKHSFLTLIKQHRNQSDVIYRQAKKFTITSESDVKSQIDGDPGPPVPVDIDIIPQAVNVLVPKKSKPAGFKTRILRAIG